MHAVYVHKTVRNHIRQNDFVVYDGGDFCHFGRAYNPALSPYTWWYLPAARNVGTVDSYCNCCQGGLPRTTGLHVHGRWGFRLQCDGVRHRCQAQSSVCRYNGERLGLGNRQADSGRRVRQAGCHGPSPVPIRSGGQRSGRILENSSSTRMNFRPRWNALSRWNGPRC